jgi:hypothetical protein
LSNIVIAIIVLTILSIAQIIALFVLQILKSKSSNMMIQSMLAINSRIDMLEKIVLKEKESTKVSDMTNENTDKYVDKYIKNLMGGTDDD